VQFITGAYQPILVLSGVVCLVGLIAWARDARAGDPMVDHARRITHVRRYEARLRARDAWQSIGSVPMARVAPSPAERIAGGFARVLGSSGRRATRTVATAGAWMGSGVHAARPRVAIVSAGVAGTVSAVASRAWTEGRSLVSGAAAAAIPVAARAGAALRSAVAEPAPGAGREAQSDRQIVARDQVPGWLMGVQRPDASAIPFGPLSGAPAPVPTSVEPQLDRERRRLG
jgi:hypothetical protein